MRTWSSIRLRGITFEIAALLMILFGVLIIVFPGLVALLVGSYLVVAGLVPFRGHVSGPERVKED